MDKYYDYNNYNKIKENDDINFDEVNVALMYEFVFASEDKPILATYGLSACMGIVIEDEIGKCALGHILSNYETSILEILSQMKKGNIKVSIIPGYDTYTLFLRDLLTFLRSLKEYNLSISIVKLQDYVDKNTDSIEFAYDTRTKKYLKPDFDKYFEYMKSKKNR